MERGCKVLDAYAGLLPGKLLDIPETKPVLWTRTAKALAIGMGAGMGLALLLLACCTCWFFGLFQRVPVKRDDEPPLFSDPAEDQDIPAVKVREASAAPEKGISVNL